jgi:hypothetical protein
MVVVLGGQGSDNGEHKDENAKGKSLAWSSRRIKASERWPVHVDGETTRGQSVTAVAAVWNRWHAVEMLTSGSTWFRYFLNEFHSFANFEIQNRCLPLFQKYSNFA